MASITIQIEGDNRAQRIFDQVISDIDALAQRVRRFSSDAIRYLASQRRVVDGLRSAYSRLGGVIRNVARIGAIGILGGVVAGGTFAVRAAVDVDTLRDSLIAFTGSVDEANRRLERLRDLANLPGISFQGAALAAVQLEGVSLEASRAEGLIRGLGNALALVGRTDLSPAVRAISQIISRGEVLQEEINQLVEATPIASRALTQEFGTTLAENIRGQLEGGVDEFITRLTNALDRLPRANVEGAANVFQNFRNAVRDLAAQIGQLALPELTRNVRELTRYLQQNSDLLLTRVRTAIDTVAASIDELIRNFTRFTNFLRSAAFAGVLVNATNVIVNLANAFGRVTVSVPSSAGIAPFLGQIGRIGTVAVAATGGLAALSLAIAGFDLVRFIVGAGRAVEEGAAWRDNLREIRDAADEARRAVNAFTQATEDQALLDSFPERLLSAFADVRTQFRDQESLTGPVDEAIRELGNADRRIQGLGRFIFNLRLRLRDIGSEVELVSGNLSDNPNARRQQQVRLRRLRQESQEIRGILTTYERLFTERAAILQRISGAQEVVNLTTTDTAEVRNFALELLNADENVRQLQERFRGFSQIDLSFFETLTQLNDALGERVAVALAPIDRQIQEQEEIANNARASEEARADAETRLRELAVERRRVVIQYERDITDAYQRETDLREQAATRESEGRVSFAERSRQRQLAIGRDLDNRARVQTRQRIQADLTDARNESAEQQRIQFDSNRRILESIFNRLYEERTATRQNVDAYTAMADRILSQYERIAAGARRVARRTQEAFRLSAARQTREQRSVVEEFVGTDDEENLRARLRPLYDAYIEGKQRTADLSIEIADRQVEAEIDIYRQLVDSTLDLALDRDRSFREVAGQFLRQSVRIIVQSFFETQVLIRNNERIIESNLRVAQSRSAAFGLPAGGAGGVPNLIPGFGGGSLTGGVGALGVAGLLFPNEFANLGQGISQVFSRAARAVVNTDGNVNVDIGDIRLLFDDGTSRKVGDRRSQNERRRR